MATKKPQKVKKEKSPGEKGKTDQAAPVVEEKPFDLGGLPERDFKKGLGCGG
jgi:hypothetical protein